MKDHQKILPIFVILLANLVTLRIISQSSAEDQVRSRRLGDEELITYETKPYPYYMGMDVSNMGTIDVPFNGQEFDPKLEPPFPTINSKAANGQKNPVSITKNTKVVYNIMHFPGYSNNPFNFHDMSLAWDPYYGLKPPFNLHHPLNYMQGFQPYANPGYAPLFPNMHNDPFKTGIYGGYGYGLYGMANQPPINPMPAMTFNSQIQISQLKELLKNLEAQLDKSKKVAKKTAEVQKKVPAELVSEKPTPKEEALEKQAAKISVLPESGPEQKNGGNEAQKNSLITQPQQIKKPDAIAAPSQIVGIIPVENYILPPNESLTQVVNIENKIEAAGTEPNLDQSQQSDALSEENDSEHQPIEESQIDGSNTEHLNENGESHPDENQANDLDVINKDKSSDNTVHDQQEKPPNDGIESKIIENQDVGPNQPIINKAPSTEIPPESVNQIETQSPANDNQSTDPVNDFNAPITNDSPDNNVAETVDNQGETGNGQDD